MRDFLINRFFWVFLGFYAQVTVADLFPVCSKGRWGYIDNHGVLKIEYKYDFAQTFSEGCAFVRKDERAFFISENDEVLFELQDEPTFCYAEPFSCGLSLVNKKPGGEEFYIDRQGRRLRLPVGAKSLSSFACGLASVKIDGKYGYIDQSGSLVISNKYDFAVPFVDGVARVWERKVFFCIDKEGVTIRNQKYEKVIASYLPTGISIVLLSQASEETGNEPQTIGRQYSEKKKVQNCIVVDHEGNQVGDSQFKQVGLFKEGKVFVCSNKKWGFVDATGRICIGLKYDMVLSISPKSDGIIAVQIGDKWGYIDDRGKIFIEPQFYEVENFQNGLAKVTNAGDDWGYIDKTGKYVWRNVNR